MNKCKPDCTECCCKPCGLCEARAETEGVFVALFTEDLKTHLGYVCGACMPTHSPPIDESLDSTLFWDEDSDGWTGPIDCMDCKQPIPVVIGDAAS